MADASDILYISTALELTVAHGGGITVIKMTRVCDFVALKAYLEKLQHCVVDCLIALQASSNVPLFA